MRTVLVLLALLVAQPVSAAAVRVKSEHKTVQLAGDSATFHLVSAEEVLRGSTLGPREIKVVLRRLGAQGAKPLPVKLMRDGRQVARMLVGGKPTDAVEGQQALAAEPIEKTIQIPGGPHTIFVEVGKGAGGLLVAFEEPGGIAVAPLVAPASGASKPAPATGRVSVAPLVAQAAANPASAAPASGATAASASAPVASAPATSPAPTASEPAPATAPVASAPAASPAPTASEPSPATAPVASAPATSPAPTASEPSPATAPQQLAASDLAEIEPLPATVPVVASEPVPSPAKTQPTFWVGLRAGGTSHLQLGGTGPAAGLSVRYALTGGPETRSLLVGLSGDFMRYSMTYQVSGRPSVPAYTHALTVTTVPAQLELTYALGGGWITPLFGVSVGASFASIRSESAFEIQSETRALLTGGAHAGVETPLGPGRLGLELRLIHAQTSDEGLARNLNVGGLLAQASWRLAL